jgi:phosphoglycerate dehydrogenase-like enzyme
MKSLLHLAQQEMSEVFSPFFLEEIRKIGNLEIVEHGQELSDEEKIVLLQRVDIALTGWESAPLPPAIVDAPGSLQYVCNVTGAMSQFIPAEIIESDILVTNWGDSPAISIAEGTVALLLAVLKDLHKRTATVRDGGWSLDGSENGGKYSGEYGGTLFDTTLGLYGCGAIGRRFANLIRPFGPRIFVYDPYCTELPDGCARVDSLDALFRRSQIAVICAGLSDETRKSVTAELLSFLPLHGVVINTARGAIVDQDALFAELESGRLRAGLDVLDPDRLPDDHPARTWQNCIFTAHEINRGWPVDEHSPPRLAPMHKVCLENLNAFIEGRPVRFEMDIERYRRST